MNLSDEIRKQIEKNKGLKLAIGEVNNNLSILEELVRKDIMEQVDEAYQKGYDKGYADKTNNIEVCNKIAKDNQDEAYQRGLDDAWEAARKIVLSPDEGGTSLTDIYVMFGNNGSMQRVFRSYSASEVIEKLKACEEKRKANEEIMVGNFSALIDYLSQFDESDVAKVKYIRQKIEAAIGENIDWYERRKS